MRHRCLSLFMLFVMLAIVLQSAKTPAKTPVKPVPVSSPVVSKQPAPNPALISAGQLNYQNQCSFCHQAKPVNVLPDLKAWTKLLYTSACPQFSIRLTDKQRKEMLAFIEQEYKKTALPSTLK